MQAWLASAAMRVDLMRRNQPNITMPAAAANIMIPTNASITSSFGMLRRRPLMLRRKRKSTAPVQAVRS